MRTKKTLDSLHTQIIALRERQRELSEESTTLVNEQVSVSAELHRAEKEFDRLVEDARAR